MENRHVVTVVIYSQTMNKILVLKRSEDVGTYKGAWACISGYIEPEDKSDMERALKEVREETTLDAENIEMLKPAGILEVEDNEKGIVWHVHIFLAVIKPGAENIVKIDWEHNEYLWVNAEDIKNMETVPGLCDAVKMALSLLQ